MPHKHKMSELELVAFCQAKISDTEMYSETLQEERKNNLERYNTQPYGDEQEGESQVLSADVYETISWIMPELMEMFAGHKSVVTFKPYGHKDPEIAKRDSELASQESEYCRYVYNVQNNGFVRTYTWFKDALVQKTGYVRVFYQEKVEEEQETYQELTELDLAQMASDDEIEIKSMEFDAATGTHTVTVSRKSDVGQIMIENIAPENLLVDRNWNEPSLANCPFVCFKNQTTRSALIEAGYDYDLVMSIPINSEDDITDERISRYKDEGGLTYSVDSIVESSTSKIWIYECWVRVDYDDDGIAELRKVVLAGKQNNIVLESDRCDFVEIIALTPDPESHRHYGTCPADQVIEIQKIKTQLYREVLNNLYLSNRPRTVVNTATTEIDDLLTARIGGIIRTRGDVNSALREQAIPFVAGQSIDVIKYFDTVSQKRTGVMEMAQGLDPASMKDQSIYGMSSLMTAAQKKILLIGRIFAETGFKELMQRVRELSIKYVDKQEIIEVDGDYIEADPRRWRKKRDMVALVGLGNTGVDQKRLALQAIADYQEKVIAAQGTTVGPAAFMVDASNVYNTLSDMVEAFGLSSTARFFKNPEKIVKMSEASPPQDKEAPIDQALKLEEEKIAAELQFKTVQHDDEMEIQKEKLALEKRKLELDLRKIQVEEAKAVADGIFRAEEMLNND